MKYFVFFISLLLLASCTIKNDDNVAGNSGATEIKQEMNIVTNNTDVGTKIAQDPGYMQCMDTARRTCGDGFIQAYAINNSDEAICEQFSDASLRISCKDLVISETAKKTLDETRCDALSETKKASCIQDVVLTKAVKKQDPLICNNYILSEKDTDTIENMKDRCMAYVIDTMEPTDRTWGLCGLLASPDHRLACEQKVGDLIEIRKNMSHNSIQEHPQDVENVPPSQ